MIYQLVQIIIPKRGPATTQIATLKGANMIDILAQIEAHPQHIKNLQKNLRTSWRAKDGTLHRIFLKEIVGPN